MYLFVSALQLVSVGFTFLPSSFSHNFSCHHTHFFLAQRSRIPFFGIPVDTIIVSSRRGFAFSDTLSYSMCTACVRMFWRNSQNFHTVFSTYVFPAYVWQTGARERRISCTNLQFTTFAFHRSICFLVISSVIHAYKQLSMVPPLAVQRRPSNDGARSFHVRYIVYLHVLMFGFVWINGFQQFNAT